MKKLFLALGLIFPVLSWGAINPTAEQCVKAVSAGTTVTVDGGGGWASPTSGNILTAWHVIDNSNNSYTITRPSGFASIEDYNVQGFQTNGELSWKESDGTETSISASVSVDPGDHTLLVCEWDGTDLDTSAIEVSNENTAEVASGSQTADSGSATNTSANALVLYFFGLDTDNLWTGSTVDNGTLQYSDGTNVFAGAWVSSEAVTSGASQSAILTTTDTGGTNYNTILIFGESQGVNLSGTLDQAAAEGTLVDTDRDVTVDSGDGWVTPTSGDYLFSHTVIHNGAGTPGTITPPSGFAVIEEHSSTSNAGVSYQVSCKVSAGTETTFTSGWDNDIRAAALHMVELPANDLTSTCAQAISAEYTLNDATDVTIQPTGNAINTVSDAVALSFVGTEVGSAAWFSTSFWNNSFTTQANTRLIQAESVSFVGSKVLSSAVTQTTSLSANGGTGSGAVGAIVLLEAAAGGAGTINDPAPRPGQTVTYTAAAAFASAITTLTCDGNGITAEAGATTTSADFIIPSVDEFVSGGDMANCEWEEDSTWTVGDGSTTENVTMQVQRPIAGYFGTVSCTAGTNCPGNSLFVSPITTTDDYYLEFTAGEQPTNPDANFSYGAWSAQSPAVVMEHRHWDESGSTWTAVTETRVEEQVAPENPDPENCARVVRAPLRAAYHPLNRPYYCLGK